MAGRKIRLIIRVSMAWTLVGILVGCYSSDEGPGTEIGGHQFDDGDETLPEGQSEFVSADGNQGQQSSDGVGNSEADYDAAEDSDKEDSTVEEGDIYRVLENSKILNLNAFRGLQIIDFQDPTHPSIVGRLQVSGSPVELYVYENRAIVLINNWSGYYGSRNDIRVEQKTGGLVLVVDIAEPKNPKLIDRAFVDGYIRTSRLTRGGQKAALFVAGSYYSEYETEDGHREWGSHTVVKSFDVSGEKIVERSQIELGGYVTDIQATVEALLVASHNWNEQNGQTTVALIDISNPDGTMIMGSKIQTAGYVESKFNMNLYKGVLRIASGSSWGGTRENHVQTFDATDFGNLSELDHCTFGKNEQLYATIFLGNKAFFVTYFRTDPFHAFQIDDDGTCRERSEFIVSGWNDYFRPVFDETRLLGIGVNDENKRTMAVSLYDITDLEKKNPLIKRVEVAAESSWSEASWDDRAFSVLENAVSVTNADGTPETGLVLLPFQGWDSNWNNYFSGVQIYTFSESTLTRRGVMDHGSAVRRSFQPKESLTANLSEEELSLFESSAPDSPGELGRVALAPNYSDVLRYGKYSVRVRKPGNGYNYWYSNGNQAEKSYAEIILTSEHPDKAEALGTLEMDGSAEIFKVHTTLFSVSSKTKDTQTYPYTYETTIKVFDMASPLNPKELVSIKTDKLKPGYNGGYYWEGAMDCWDCGWGYGGNSFRHTILNNAVVFPIINSEQKKIGTEKNCYQESDYRESCWRKSYDKTGGTCYQGGIYCTSVNSGDEFCRGEIEKCEVDGDGNVENCATLSTSEISFPRNCHTSEKYRYWNSYSFLAVDLTGDLPVLRDPIPMPVEDEGTGVVGYGNSLFFSYKRPFDIKGDARPYVKYYFKEIDLEVPSSPELGKSVNIPGTLIDVRDDLVYTQDVVWGAKVVETTLNKLEVKDGKAYRLAGQRFIDQAVHKIVLDPSGRALVGHRLAWNADFDYNDAAATYLTILDDDSFKKLGSIEVDDWASLSSANGGRALFEVPGGLLIINLQNVSYPFAQAYFPVRGWPQSIYFEDDEIVFAAGRYGIYQFDVDMFNLLSL